METSLIFLVLTLGFTASANYRNETEYYDDFQFNSFIQRCGLNIKISLIPDIVGTGTIRK